MSEVRIPSLLAKESAVREFLKEELGLFCCGLRVARCGGESDLQFLRAEIVGSGGEAFSD